MLQVMLCGAADTDSVRQAFAEVVQSFGGEPWHYLSGKISHLNSLDSRWIDNSEATVDRADLCVFVIVVDYGEITWTTELRRALAQGKPFLILCLDRTYQKYLSLRAAVSDPSLLKDRNAARLIDLLRELEAERQLTVIQYTQEYFAPQLKFAMSDMFQFALTGIERRNRRRSALDRLTGDGPLSAIELPYVVSVAQDEYEPKTVRKKAVLALAQSGVDEVDDILEILRTDEQGVQRLAFSLLTRLYRVRPVDPDFLAQSVAIANESDDVGVARRLVPQLFEFGLAEALQSLPEVEFTELGVRRRVADALLSHEAEIVADGFEQQALQVLSRCFTSTVDASWIKRARALESRLAPPAPDAG